MSLISEQVKRLREYASDRRGEIADICNDAADTIEELSTKLHAANMERSSAHYHRGWIPVSERLPENQSLILTTVQIPGREPKVRSGVYHSGLFSNDNGDVWRNTDSEVKAWMPMPEPYCDVSKDSNKKGGASESL